MKNPEDIGINLYIYTFYIKTEISMHYDTINMIYVKDIFFHCNFCNQTYSNVPKVFVIT